MITLHYFSLVDIAIGEFVEVKHFVDETNGDNIATRLEKDKAPSIKVVVSQPGVVFTVDNLIWYEIQIKGGLLT